MQVYSRIQPNTAITKSDTLHLIELTDSILKEISNDDNFTDSNKKLEIKAFSHASEPYLITSNEAYLIRMKNHSNTMMLLSDAKMISKQKIGDQDQDVMEIDEQEEDKMVGLKIFGSQLELTKVNGTINTKGIPYLTSLKSLETDTFVETPITLKKIYENSTLPRLKFKEAVQDLNITEINGCCYIVSDAILLEVLYLLITLIVSNGSGGDGENSSMNQFNDLESNEALIKLFQDDNNTQTQDAFGSDQHIQYPVEIIQLILDVYIEDYETENKQIKRRLNHDKVVKLFGIEALKNHARKYVKEDEFLLNLRTSLPYYYNPDISTSLLTGYYIKHFDSALNQLKYFDRSILAPDIQTRLKQLFNEKYMWDINEIESYVKDANNKGLPIEKFLMKFAKVKRMGKKTFVSSK